MCSSFRVNFVWTRSVENLSSLDLSQPLIVLGPHPSCGGGEDLRFKTLRVTGMEWPLNMQLLRIGLYSRP